MRNLEAAVVYVWIAQYLWRVPLHCQYGFGPCMDKFSVGLSHGEGLQRHSPFHLILTRNCYGYLTAKKVISLSLLLIL